MSNPSLFVRCELLPDDFESRIDRFALMLNSYQGCDVTVTSCRVATELFTIIHVAAQDASAEAPTPTALENFLRECGLHPERLSPTKAETLMSATRATSTRTQNEALRQLIPATHVEHCIEVVKQPTDMTSTPSHSSEWADDCSTQPTDTVPIGTTVALKYNRAPKEKPSNDPLTPTVDVFMAVERPCTYGQALALLEAKAKQFIVAHGGAGLRGYMIERVDAHQSGGAKTAELKYAT